MSKADEDALGQQHVKEEFSPEFAGIYTPGVKNTGTAFSTETAKHTLSSPGLFCLGLRAWITTR